MSQTLIVDRSDGGFPRLHPHHRILKPPNNRAVYIYVIIGETHPLIKLREGEAYRTKLQVFIKIMGLERHVAMLNQYLTEGDLIKYLVFVFLKQ